MRTRILFLDDEPGLCRKLQTMLEERGYKVVHPKTVDEAVREISVHGAELLVHCAHTTETHWGICCEIFNLYPTFPSLHLATGPVSAEKHKVPHGPFHQSIRHLAPEREFMSRVRRMIFLGRLDLENRAMRKAMTLVQSADRIFDTLDIEALKARSVEFFGDSLKAKDVFWLLPGSFNYYLHDMWKVVPLSGDAGLDLKEKKHEVVSWRPTSSEAISDLVKSVSDHLPSGWEFRTTPFFLDRETRSQRPAVCLIPIVGSQSKAVLGHVAVVEPALWGDLGIDRSLPNILRLLGRHTEHALSFGNARNLSYIDDLTDLYNQRYLRVVLDKEIYRAQRSNNSFSVLFMDIDHFKRVNDTSGHIVGSKVLIEISRVIKNCIRTIDYGFRYGGDEFMCILVGTSSQQAAQVAERIRQAVEAESFEINGVKLKITLSIGIASYPEHARTREEIIEMADRAMYCGKARSRNVVYIAS